MKNIKTILNFTLSSLFLLIAYLSPASAALNCQERSNFPSTVNVKWYGAVGDGKSDDTDSFHHAMLCARHLFKNSRSEKPTIIVAIPPGQYLLKRKITLNLSAIDSIYRGAIIIKGGGKNRTTLIGQGKDHLLDVILDGRIDKKNLKHLGSVDLKIKNLAFNTSAPEKKSAIHIWQSPSATHTLPHRFTLITNLHLKHLKIETTDSGYFMNSISATGLNRPLIENVSVQNRNGKNKAGSSCFNFGASYGVLVRSVQCSGAWDGVNIPFAAEGDQVLHSKFENVQVGIRISAVPYSKTAGDTPKWPGPSPLDGRIFSNLIVASKYGVLINNKAQTSIENNVFHNVNSGKGHYYDVHLINPKHFMVTGNKFIGAQQNRTGVAINGKKTSLTIITGNKFGNIGTGVYQGKGVEHIKMYNNTFHSPVTRGLASFGSP